MGSTKKSTIVLIALLAIVSLSVILFIVGSLLPEKLKENKATTEVVERGKVASITKATGVVESENEVLVLSPATSIIEKILKEPGDYVERGEIILQLNTESVEESIERMRNQVEVRKNNLEKTRLNAQSAKLDQDYNEEVKRLRFESLKSQLADQEQLLEVGGISPSRLEQTRQEITLAEKDMNMLVEKNAIRLKQLVADEEGLLLQIKIDEKALNDNIDLLSKLNVRAPSSGIILNITGNVGQRINADATLIRMSDLSSFKLIGSIDEQLASQLKTGASVTVILEDEKLQGQIGSITPMVENNKVQFNVHLKENNHPKLIANQTVEILINNSEKDNVVRIKKQPAFEKGKIQKVTVLNDNKTIQKEITLGILGNEYCEVLSGLEEGDVILINN
ncbi:MAG: HlyD family efflux transporter periplasmic adaptor subunit [Prolixibacteraceae bacterium]|nr:HlyD family efflux transporter periplasmic adaptor subunit [Prolixibacteraceae bacterium]